MEPLLQAEHITICYHGTPVVCDVSFEIQKGEILGIVGDSGSGKSSIIKAVTGLLGNSGMVTRGDVYYKGLNVVDMPKGELRKLGDSGSGKSSIIKAVTGLLGNSGMVTRGDVYYKGLNVVDMPKGELRKLLGPEIGVVFQDCKSALCPVRKVGDQIFESMKEHRRISRKESDCLASSIMEKIGLKDPERVLDIGLKDPERVLDSYPFELSGGMNQRVGICTAMMQNPPLLLADEPTSALDVTVQKQVVEELKLMRKEYGTAMIVVTHNMGVIKALTDQVLVLKEGKQIRCLY